MPSTLFFGFQIEFFSVSSNGSDGGEAELSVFLWSSMLKNLSSEEKSTNKRGGSGVFSLETEPLLSPFVDLRSSGGLY